MLLICTSAHASEVPANVKPPLHLSLGHVIATWCYQQTSSFLSSRLWACILAETTIDTQVVIHKLSRPILTKIQEIVHLITMDSPIVKATIQSTLLGALSNIIGQLIGCWQSGVSRLYVHSLRRGHYIANLLSLRTALSFASC